MRKAGFTLIELMVAAVIFAIVLAGVFQTFSVQNETHAVVDQVTEAQQNLRAVVDLMERDARLAGYLVPVAGAACVQDSTTTPDVLFLSSADAIRSVTNLETDYPHLLAGGLGVGATVGGAITGTVNVQLDDLFIDVDLDGDDFVPGGGMILTDKDDANGKAICGRITNTAATWPAAPGPFTLSVDFGSTNNYGTAAGTGNLVAIPAHVYRIVPATASTPSQLFRNGLLLANDVEDLQIALYFDDNDDRVLDAGEVYADAGTSTYSQAITDAGAGTLDMTKLRELQINVVTVTRDDDPNTDFPAMRGQATGNRTAASAAGPDRRRRRVNSARVRIRNQG